MKHIIIFFVYNNLDIIIKSFENLKTYNADFFVVENFSESSMQIKEYFINNNLKGYIQFEENIAANALNIFIKDYYNLLNEYDYITFTDGDIICYDINGTFNEILNNLKENKCIVSSCDLYLGNSYTNPNRKIGLEHYYEFIKIHKPSNQREGQTGAFLLTLQNKDLHLLKNIHFIDTNVYHTIKKAEGRWLKTVKNLCYHLTWDLYIEGNEYFEWKKKVYPKIWDKIEGDFKYKILR